MAEEEGRAGGWFPCKSCPSCSILTRVSSWPNSCVPFYHEAQARPICTHLGSPARDCCVGVTWPAVWGAVPGASRTFPEAVPRWLIRQALLTRGK